MSERNQRSMLVISCGQQLPVWSNTLATASPAPTSNCLHRHALMFLSITTPQATSTIEFGENRCWRFIVIFSIRLLTSSQMMIVRILSMFFLNLCLPTTSNNVGTRGTSWAAHEVTVRLVFVVIPRMFLVPCWLHGTV